MSISNLQRRLQTLGHDPGAIDGIGGPKTAGAFEAFLRAQGLPMRVTATARSLAATGPVAVVAATPPVVTKAKLYQGTAKHEVREIIVHCAATRPDWMANRPIAEKVAEIRRWHVQGNGWADTGYHWVIDRDGAFQAGRPETVIGAHVAGHNSGTTGVCLLGGYNAAAADRFRDHFTVAQDLALRQLIAGISLRARIEKITGHNQYAAKGCPGFHVPTWLKGD